jgi:hypothetical protein
LLQQSLSCTASSAQPVISPPSISPPLTSHTAFSSNKLTFSHKFPLFGCSVRRAYGPNDFSFFRFSRNYPKFSTHGSCHKPHISPQIPTFPHKPPHFPTNPHISPQTPHSPTNTSQKITDLHPPPSSLANREPTNISTSIYRPWLAPPSPPPACSSIMAVIVDDRPSWPRNTSLPTPDPQLELA